MQANFIKTTLNLVLTLHSSTRTPPVKDERLLTFNAVDFQAVRLPK